MKALPYVLISILLIVLLTPLYIMTIGSFTEISGFLKKPPSLILRNPTLANYTRILSDSPVLLWCANSLIVAGSTVLLSVSTIILAGYCFSRYPGRIINVLYAALLLGVMIPKNALIIPMFILIKNIGLSGSLAAVILPSVFYPVGLFIYKTYLDKIPKTYDDCARMDGAKELTIITRVIMPMSRPAIAAIATFSLMGSLQEFMWQFLILQRTSLYTLLIGLTRKAYASQLAIFGINPIGLKMATGMVLFVPLAAIYGFLHRYYLEGIMTGGIKG